MARLSRIVAFLGPLAVLGFLALAPFAYAEKTYTPLVGIPGFTDENKTLPELVNALYLMTISIGGLIGVIKISMAGVKYSMSDVVTDKASAKKDIMGVLLGLAILLIPFIVLSTIYGNLTSLNVLKEAESNRVTLPPTAEKPDPNTTQPSTFSPYRCQEREQENTCSQSQLEDGTCSGERYTNNCPSECTARGGNQCVRINGNPPPSCWCTR